MIFNANITPLCPECHWVMRVTFTEDRHGVVVAKCESPHCSSTKEYLLELPHIKEIPTT